MKENSRCQALNTCTTTIVLVEYMYLCGSQQNIFNLHTNLGWKGITPSYVNKLFGPSYIQYFTLFHEYKFIFIQMLRINLYLNMLVFQVIQLSLYVSSLHQGNQVSSFSVDQLFLIKTNKLIYLVNTHLLIFFQQFIFLQTTKVGHYTNLLGQQKFQFEGGGR